MTKKSAECYTALFQFLEEKVFKLEPSEIITDFEGGMRKALKQVYSTATLRGCWYHYCAAIRKKCLRLGLNSTIQADIGANEIYQRLLHLPLLPADNFLEGYDLIKKRAHEYGIWKEFSPMFNYYDSYWLAEVNFLTLHHLLRLRKYSQTD